jgi:cell division protein ZapA
MKKDMDSKSIRVKIFGTEYPLRGEDEELTRQAASYVDSLMNQFHDRIPEHTPATIAVLTALNIAEELLKSRKINQLTIDEIEDQVKSISDKIRIALNTT